MLVSRQHKQHNLQVSGGKATLVARVLCYVRTAQQILEPEDNDATSDSELQSSDSEDQDNSEDDAQSKAVYTTEKFGTDPLKSDTDRKFLQICFFLMGTDLCFFGFGAIDAYGPKTQKNTGVHRCYIYHTRHVYLITCAVQHLLLISTWQTIVRRKEKVKKQQKTLGKTKMFTCC